MADNRGSVSRELRWLGLYLAASFGAAALGSLFTTPSVRTWYPTLRKPSWTPPSKVFPIVWTVLYVHIAVAAWLVRRGMSENPGRQEAGDRALQAWYAQLAFNTLWSLVFFGAHQIGGGLAVIGVLWSLILATIVRASRVTRIAAVLLVPYLAWTSFASALNFRIWRLNRGR